MISMIIHVLKFYKQWNTYLILLRLLLLAYYLQKTKVWNKNLKPSTHWNAWMINILQTIVQTDLDYQLDN